MPPGKKGFAKNTRLYRAFLVNFLKKPLFNRKYITKALGSVLKSESSRDRAYLIIRPYKNKVRNDLKILQENPDAFVDSIEEYIQKTSDSNINSKKENFNNSSIDNEKISCKKLKSTELIDSINKEIQSLKAKMNEFEKTCSNENDGDSEVTTVPPVPGSVFIKDLKKLVSPPPLIDLTVDDEEENKVNMRNSINLIGSLSQNSNVQYSETLQVSSVNLQKVTGKPKLTALLTQKVASHNQNQQLQTSTEIINLSAAENNQITHNFGPLQPTAWTQNMAPPLYNSSQFAPPNALFFPPTGNFPVFPNFANDSRLIYYQPTIMQQIRIDNVPQEPNANWPFTYYQ